MRSSIELDCHNNIINASGFYPYTLYSSMEASSTKSLQPEGRLHKQNRSLSDLNRQFHTQPIIPESSSLLLMSTNQLIPTCKYREQSDAISHADETDLVRFGETNKQRKEGSWSDRLWVLTKIFNYFGICFLQFENASKYLNLLHSI